MKHIGKIVIGVALAAGLIGGGVWVAQQRAAQNPETRFKLATVDKGEVIQTVSANGTLTPLVLVNVGTQVSGTVKKLYVDFNDKVEAGQKMLELDQSLMAAQAKQSEANVLNVSASVELARANAVRMKALFEKEYVSRQEYDQAMQVLKSAEAQLAQARAAAEVVLAMPISPVPKTSVVAARLLATSIPASTAITAWVLVMAGPWAMLAVPRPIFLATTFPSRTSSAKSSLAPTSTTQTSAWLHRAKALIPAPPRMKLYTIWVVTSGGYSETPSAVTPWSPTITTTFFRATGGCNDRVIPARSTARSMRSPRAQWGMVNWERRASALWRHSRSWG